MPSSTRAPLAPTSATGKSPNNMRISVSGRFVVIEVDDYSALDFIREISAYTAQHGATLLGPITCCPAQGHGGHYRYIATLTLPRN